MSTAVKCVVCGAEYEGGSCPVCGFPAVKILGDPEEGLRKLRPEIEACRRVALDRLSVGIVSFYWKGVEDSVVLDREERREIAVASALKGGPVWLDEQFARDPDAEELEVCVSLTLGGREARRSVPVANLREPRLQQIGASLDGEGRFLIHLRNGASESVSAPAELFPLFA